MPDDEPPPIAPPIALYRLLPLAVLIVGGVMFVAFGGYRWLTPAALADHRHWLCDMVAHSGVEAIAAFILAYAGFVSLSVPGGALLTMTGGFLFGTWLGALYSVVGATVGATIVFVAARAGLAGLAARAGPLTQRLVAGLREEGFNYLIALRLIPVVPFWLVNLAAGVIGLPLFRYVLGTFIGIIPVTVIYASLGNGFGTLLEEGRHPDMAILFEPGVLLPILALAAMALLPVAVRRWRRRGLRIGG